MEIKLHQGDLPHDLVFGSAVAIDTETMGLNPFRDRLCLVQLSFGDEICHLIQMDREKPFQAPRLKTLLTDPNILKIFHFARFDVAALMKSFHVAIAPVYCTKVASKLVRTFTERHGLKELCRELLGVDISKAEQTSDWGAPDLRSDQLKYAATDVLYLHRLKEKLDVMLKREGRQALAHECFSFLPTRAALDLAGWADQDIFQY